MVTDSNTLTGWLGVQPPARVYVDNLIEMAESTLCVHKYPEGY